MHKLLRKLNPFARRATTQATPYPYPDLIDGCEAWVYRRITAESGVTLLYIVLDDNGHDRHGTITILSEGNREPMIELEPSRTYVR